MNSLRISLIAVVLAAALSGCDFLQQSVGIETSAAKAARDDAEGQAVGGACRQSGRAIEDCYSIYSWLPKTAIYGGWRDMDVYMRENNLETIAPQLPPPQPPPPPPPPPPPKKKAKPKPADDTETGRSAKSA